MEEIIQFVESVNIYLQMENPVYTKRISYWKKQRDYAQMILDNEYEPTPRQLSIIKGNTDSLVQLVNKISK